MSNSGVCLFFPVGKACGGAERRLIRTFGALFHGTGREVAVLIHDIGLTSAVKKSIDQWSKGRAVYFPSLFDVCAYIAKRRFRWICAASLGYTTTLVFAVAAFYGTKRLFACVHNKSALLMFQKRSFEKRFKSIVYTASSIDCLYPNAIEGLKMRYPKKKITLTPGAFTDLDQFAPGPKQRVIAFAATLTEGKGVELLIEAIGEMKQTLASNSYVCVICGDGPLLNYVKQSIQDRGLDSVLVAAGRVDTADILQKASIFCSLQTPTNYPSQSLIEAMACGCYCIVTDTGESSLMITEEFGTLIGYHKDSLAEALERAMKITEAERDAITGAARQYVLANFTIGNTVAHYENLLG